MNDLISRQAAIDAIGEKPFAGTADEYDYEQGLQNQWERDVVAIKILPSAEPERKKGKWIKEYWNSKHTRKCSECNITQTVTTYNGKVIFNYCPYCGAEMSRGE